MPNFPNEATAGIPDGVTLTPSGDVVVNKAGTTISGLDIKGTVYINADNVTLENCKVTSTAFYAVKVSAGVEGAVVQNCEIDGVGTGNEGSNGLAGQGTFLNNEIYNVENGITLQGDNSHIEGNYIHDLKASGSPHYDGIQIDGGISDTVIRNNTVVNDHGQTAAIMIDNYFGPISNIEVDGNLLVGGGYTLYSDAQFDGGRIEGVSFTNNTIGEGHWGPLYVTGPQPEYSGNTMNGHEVLANLDSQPAPSEPEEPTEPDAPAPDPDDSDNGDNDGSDSGSGDTGGSDSDGGSDTPDTGTDNPETPDQPDQPLEEVLGSWRDDTLTGDDAANLIEGGHGADTMTGGAGDDVFRLTDADDTGRYHWERDTITDFTPGEDVIDLSQIDANGWQRGDGEFRFHAQENQVFDGDPAALAWHYDDAWGGEDKTIIQADLDGDGTHDFELQLTGHVALTEDNFIL